MSYQLRYLLKEKSAKMKIHWLLVDGVEWKTFMIEMNSLHYAATSVQLHKAFG